MRPTEEQHARFQPGIELLGVPVLVGSPVISNGCHPGKGQVLSVCKSTYKEFAKQMNKGSRIKAGETSARPSFSGVHKKC